MNCVEQVAQILLEAARTAQSAAGKREKEMIVQSPLMPLPAVLQEQLIESDLLPKERWLASFCQSEKARRRRVLVYVRQTGTRDIQERIETVLKDAGLRTITLYSSVDPRRREAWIEKHADADVLITNPRLVQTGLDLVSFAYGRVLRRSNTRCTRFGRRFGECGVSGRPNLSRLSSPFTGARWKPRRWL